MAEYKLSYTANEINEKLGKVDEIDSLKNLVGNTSVESQINQAIADENLEKYALKTEIPFIPENISSFNNDKNYQTETQVDEAVQDMSQKIDDKLDEIRNNTLELEAVLYDGTVMKFNILGQEVST